MVGLRICCIFATRLRNKVEQLKIKIMVTIKFINVNGKGQMTVKDSQKENVINSLLAVGYGILKIEQ